MTLAAPAALASTAPAASASTGNTAGAAGAWAPADIAGVLPPSGPPFVVTVALILLLAAVAVARKVRKKGRVAEAASSHPCDREGDLASLRELYLQGKLSESLLFERIEEMLRSRLPVCNPALTCAEIVAASRGSLPETTARLAASLLELSEQVRFGRHVPGKDEALCALDRALEAAGELQEGGV